MRLVLLSDTHVPGRARDLPPALWSAIESADAVLHAGDWTRAALVTAVASRARRLVGCYGNNDGPDVQTLVPLVARATFEGVRFVVVHETGTAAGRERRLERLYGDSADVVVFGHSHIPWDTTAPGGLRVLNPGSPTDKRRQPVGTWLELEVDGGAVVDVAWREVPG